MILRGFIHSVTYGGAGSNFEFDMTSIRENSGFQGVGWLKKIFGS